MSTSTNKAVIERMFTEVMNGKNTSLVDSFIAPDFQHRTMQLPFPGPEGFKILLNGFLGGFPDMHIKVDHIVAEGDMVATAGTWGGTNAGEFMGMPATGRKISNIPFIDLWRFRDGKAVENWVQMDNIAIMTQLGHMPQPA